MEIVLDLDMVIFTIPFSLLLEVVLPDIGVALILFIVPSIISEDFIIPIGSEILGIVTIYSVEMDHVNGFGNRYI